MHLLTRFYLLILPALVIIAGTSIMLDRLETRRNTKELAKEAVLLDLEELGAMAEDPLFSYYLADKARGYEDDANRDLADIRALFEQAMVEAERHRRQPVRFDFYSRDWELLVDVFKLRADAANKTSFSVEQIRGLAESGEERQLDGGRRARTVVNEDIHHAVVPLGVDGNSDGRLAEDELQGYLHSSQILPLARFAEQAGQHRKLDLLLGALQILLLAALLALGARHITRPFRSLVKQASEIAGRDPRGMAFPDEFKVDGGRTLEVDALTQALNNMLRAIKRQQSDLMEARDEALRADTAKSRFLAAASHDLRQPIQALNLFVSVLARQENDERTAEIIDKIKNSLRALAELLDSLLDISRLEAGAVLPEYSDVAIAPLMQELVAEFLPVADARGIELRVLPCRRSVRSDPVLLTRLLRNLLSNAVRYTDQGRVVLGCRRKGRRLRLQVFDTGIGMPVDQLPLIFQEFHQVGNPARDRREGLGIGLAIVRRLADLLNIEVQVESVEGKGSCFTVELPMALNRQSPAGPAAAGEDQSLAGITVLVVDDEPDIRTAVQWDLEKSGCTVVAAASGAEARAIVTGSGRTVPDVLIIDYRLGKNETGIDVTASLRALTERQIPAILVTGDTAPDRLREAMSSGLVLLHKPVTADTLRAAVDEAVHGRNAQRAAAGGAEAS